MSIFEQYFGGRKSSFGEDTFFTSVNVKCSCGAELSVSSMELTSVRKELAEKFIEAHKGHGK